MKTAVVLCLALLAAVTEHAKIPQELQLCPRAHPNFNDCLGKAIAQTVKNIRNGIKSIQVLPVDPLFLPKIQLREDKNKPVALNLDLIDVQLIGLTTVRPLSAQSDFDRLSLQLDALFSQLELYTDYNMDGKFLLLPIKGHGKANATIGDVTLRFNITANPLTKNGHKHWEVQTLKVTVKDVQAFRVIFHNLFNGDKTLGDATNKVINENWKEFVEALIPVVEEAFGAAALQAAKQVFGRFSEDELFPPPDH